MDRSLLRPWSALWLLLLLASPGWVAAVAGQTEPSGSIEGTVIDASTGKGVNEAAIEVAGERATTRTDAEGKFKVSLKPGTYELRVSAPLYKAFTIRSMAVSAGATARAEVRLQPEAKSGEVEVIDVFGRQVDEASQILKRQEAGAVSDTISEEVIKKSTDSDAAEIVQRIPAVTIAEDKFLVVRGLGDRYSSAILNGSRLPSTDPDKRVVSLDLFPADFISSLNLVKSFTPDLPGDFAGGLVDIELKDAPSTLAYSIGVSSSYNTQTTFKDFDTYEGTDLDYIGFGAGFRELPGRIPDGNITTPEAAQQREYAAGFRNIWDVDSMEAPPNLGVDFSIGNTFGPLGLGLGATYENEFKRREREKVASFANVDTFPDQPTLFTFDRSRFETNLGAVAIASLHLADGHKVVGRGFVNRNTSDEVLAGNGVDEEQDVNRRRFPTQLLYRDDQLGFGQVAGEHRFGLVDVDWRTALSQTVRTQPDTRQYLYVLDTTVLPRPQLQLSQSPPRRLFLDLDETLSDSAVDFTVPFKTGLPFTDVWSGLDASFKAGAGYLVRNRDVALRRFEYNANLISLDGSLSPEVLLVPEHIGIPGGIVFRESTLREDEFKAKQDIAALYGMFTLPIVEERLRFVGGVRLEYSYIDIEGFARGQSAPVSAIINDLDPLPGINLIYSPIQDMNVRLGFSQTVSRPEFRELTPTEFPTIEGDTTVVGNPNLTSASITSYDLRWEWFLYGLNLVSASAFYKELKEPIEKIAIGKTSGRADSFENADDATLWGFELEGRHDLAPLASLVARVPYLRAVSGELYNFNLSANATYVQSEVNISASGRQTNNKRALQGQPDFVINSSLEYTNDLVGTMRLAYITIGPQIAAAGVEGLPDITAERRDQLDFAWVRKFAPFGQPLSFKLSVENILNDQFLETQGGFVTLRYVSGVKVGMGVSYSY